MKRYYKLFCSLQHLLALRIKRRTKPQIVEASCGQCQFGMEGHGCELAVRIDGKSYFVDGSSTPHGDAHAKDGFVLP
jgi:hypothetical protein